MTYYLRTIFTASALFVMLSATLALGASVTFTSSASGDYLILGNNMDGVAGIQLNVTYDKASLATPTVTQGGLVSGAMLAANTTQPGIIKIAIVSTRTFSGSGQIATISFASKTGNGRITSITTSMIDSKGSALASSVNSPASTENSLSADIPFSQPSSTQLQSTSVSAASSSTTTQTYPGVVTLPTDLQQRTDLPPVPSSSATVYPGEPVESQIAEQIKPSNKSAFDTTVGETPEFVVYKGVLERFEQYNGRKDLSTIVTLFAKDVVPTAHQEPVILLSDGQSQATLTVDIPAKTSSSPNFAVNGGKLISYKQDKQSIGHWMIEVLPDAGAVRTTVIIISEAERFEFPLTVAPPVKTTLTLDESGWNRFLKEVGTTKTPLHDLNNDGVRNYVDEFIFVANHLAKKTMSPKPVSTPNKSAK